MRKSHNSIKSFFGIGTLAVALLNSGALAAPGDLDVSFDAGSGLDLPVHAMVVQPDGKIIIGGEFRTVKGRVRNRIARLNSDGSDDASFNTALDAAQPYYMSVGTVVLQPDGRILIGGGFETVSGAGRTNFARLNPDGTLDNTFNPVLLSGTYAGGVGFIALQSDGKMVIAVPLRR